MKEFIDKLIGRLKKEHERCINRYGVVGGNLPAMEVKQCMEIVNQLAEEYKDKAIINEQYCWQTCGDTEHCKECNRLCNGSIDYYENYDCLAEEYNNGWISADVELPTKNGWYWGYYVTSSYIGKDGVKHTECKYASIYWEDNLWLYDPRSFRTVDEVIAWKPIEPYQPKGE